MSSYQLPLLAPPADATRQQSRSPIHVAFSPSRDYLAALWETGYLEVTDLRTRLGPGRGKVMDAVKLCAGYVDSAEASNLGVSEYRQVQLFAQESVGKNTDGPVKFAALGSGSTQDAKDIITIASIEHGKIAAPVTIDLPQRGGRIVPSNHQLWWQSPEGALLLSQFFLTGVLCNWLY